MEVVVAPTNKHMERIKNDLLYSKIATGCQNISHDGTRGSYYSGAMSGEQLNGASVRWVIIGTHERRKFFNESNHMI